MDTLLLFLHLLALAVGGASTFGQPLIGAAMGRTPEARPALSGISKRLIMFGRGAVTVLILTGILMVLRSWGSDVQGLWFSLKLLLVAALLALMVYMPTVARKAMAGDAEAGARIKALSPAGPAILAGIVLFAVLAFR